jgi:addiction module HigA family antidote
MTRKTELLDPIHPGEILREDFLKPMEISINRLARDLDDVPPNRISLILSGARSITADTALRLGVYFGVSPELWLNLQTDYDLRVARRTRGEKSSVACGRGPPPDRTPGQPPCFSYPKLVVAGHCPASLSFLEPF